MRIIIKISGLLRRLRLLAMTNKNVIASGAKQSRIFFFLLFLSTSCFGKPLVVTSFSILEDMTREIGQDKIDVQSLVGPNQDSHVFEPRPQDAQKLAHADLVIVNGLGFEGWLDRLIEASGFKGTLVVATKGIHPLTDTRGGRTIADPHAWHSLENAQVYVDNIVKGLSSLLPSEASFFKARGKAYKKSLKALEKEIRQELASVPPDKRKVMTGHAAFDYLGQEFSIQFYSPLGMSTEAEPSAKVIAALIQKSQKEHIQAIFIENISDPRLIKQIAREAGIQVGGLLYSDALSPPGTEADTYLKMMRLNLSSLVQAMSKKEEEGKSNTPSLTPVTLFYGPVESDHH